MIRRANQNSVDSRRARKSETESKESKSDREDQNLIKITSSFTSTIASL